MRGVGRVNAPAAVEQGRNLLFVIGVNDYDDWLVLENAVQDAESIEEVLSEQYGFTPALPALLNKQATRSSILGHLDLLRQELEPDDNLVFFFAGHGCTRADTVGQRAFQRGYIVPVDGAPLSEGRWSTYISVEELLNEIALLPARHVTLLLDACHSGIALGDDATSFRGNEEGPPLSLVGKTSRRVITSARADQLASDQGDFAGNSLFTGILTNGLRYGQADLDSDGMITTSEIGLYMQREVRRQSDDKQTPDFGSFVLDERGEMVLQVEANSPVVLRNNAKAQLRNGKVGDFLETFEKLRQLDSTTIEYLYLESLYHLFTGNVEGSIASLEERGRREKDELSEQFRSVLILTRQQMIAGLRRWSPYLQRLPSRGTEVLGIKVFAGQQEIPIDSIDLTGASYYLPTNENYSLELTNKTDTPLFVYAILLDQLGRVRPFSLWDDLDLLWRQGLQPGQAHRTSTYKPLELEGFQGIRLIISEEPIDDFILSPDIYAVDQTADVPSHFLVHNLWLIYK